VNSTKYIGMDVHTATISVAVRDATGKLIMESVLETKASQFIHGLRGELYVTFEEGTWAAWLYDLLKPYVTNVVVCDSRRNAPSLTEQLQAPRITRHSIGPRVPNRTMVATDNRSACEFQSRLASSRRSDENR